MNSKELKIRGVSFTNLKLFINVKLGNDKYKKLLDVLPGELKKFFSEEIIESQFYNLEYLLKIIDYLLKIYEGNKEELMFKIGEFSVHRAYEGPFKIIFDVSDFQSFVNSILEFAFKYYFNFGNFKIGEFEPEKGKVKIIVSEIPFKDKFFEKRLEGGIYAAFKIRGLKKLKSKITKSIAKGDDVIEIALEWEV